MAKSTGKDFELQIKESTSKYPQIYYYRLKDSAVSFNHTENTSYTPSNDYDCFMYSYPNFFPMELKSSKGTSFSFQRDKKDKGKNIKLSQIEGLTKASLVSGVYAGFLFNFSDKYKTYWMNVKDFNRFYYESSKKSLNEMDMIDYGAVLLLQELKKVKYHYKLGLLLEEIINQKKFNPTT